MNKNDCLPVGFVKSTHGLKGGLTIVLTHDIGLKVQDNIFFELNGQLVPYQITSLSNRGDKAFITLEGVHTIDVAGHLKGSRIFYPKTQLSGSQVNNLSGASIEGFDVKDQQLGHIGTVDAVIQMGNIYFLQVNHAENKQVLIPVDSPFIVEQDVQNKQVAVDLPAGYLDI